MLVKCFVFNAPYFRVHQLAPSPGNGGSRDGGNAYCDNKRRSPFGGPSQQKVP